MTDQEKAVEYHHIGVNNYQEQDYFNAIEQLEKSFKIDPLLEDNYYYLALSYRNVNQLEKARYYLLELIRMNKKYDRAYREIGYIYFMENNFSRAENFYLQALKYNQNDYQIYYYFSLLENRRNNKEAAVRNLEQALQLNPKHSLSLNLLGNYYFNHSDFNKAEEYYQKAIRTDLQYFLSLYNLGLVYEKKQEYEKAIQYFDKALDINPHYQPALIKRIKLKKKLFFEIGIGQEKNGYSYIDRKIKLIIRDINQAVEKNPRRKILERDEEIEAVLAILSKTYKNFPLLVGYPGVGITCLVEKLAEKIKSSKNLTHFKEKKIIELKLDLLFELICQDPALDEKLIQLFNRMLNDNESILFLDKIHYLFNSYYPGEKTSLVFDYLQSLLESDKMMIIASTFPDTYLQQIDQEPVLGKNFSPLLIKELTLNTVKKMAADIIREENSPYQIDLKKTDLDQLLETAGKYLKKQFFPVKAFELLNQLMIRQPGLVPGKSALQDMKQIISQLSGNPLSNGELCKSLDIKGLNKKLSRHIMGQERAIDTICNYFNFTLRHGKIKTLTPVSALLFIGSCGVGKKIFTEHLAHFLYHDQNKLLKVDLSFYSEPGSIYQLVETACDFSENPLDTQLSIKQRYPAGIILFENIEQAHSQVLNYLIRILNESMMIDSNGHYTFLTNVIFIFTTSIIEELKHNSLQAAAKSDQMSHSEQLAPELCRFLPEDFISKIDEMIIFDSITEDKARLIIENKLLSKLNKIFSPDKITFLADTTVYDFLLSTIDLKNQGLDFMEEKIDQLIIYPLLRECNEKRYQQCTLKIGMKQDQIAFICL